MLQKIAHWYFSKRALPYWAIVLLDSLSIFLSGLLIAVLTDGTVSTVLNWKEFCLSMFAYLACYLVGMRLLHTYAGVIRHSSFMDLYRVILANLIGLCLSLPLRILLSHRGLAILGYYDLVAIFLIATFTMWLTRVTIKILYEIVYKSHDSNRVFIYGTKNGGVSLAKSIVNENSQYVLAGFVSGDDKYVDKMLMGVKVVNNDLTLVEKMQSSSANVLLVSPIYSDSFREHQDLIDSLIEANIKIHMMPPTVEWDGKSDLQHEALKEVQVEDLLPREKIEVDMKRVGEMLTGKRILITGAAGSIGGEMVRQIASYNPSEMVLVDQAETPMHDLRIFLAKEYPDRKSVV